jgi:glycosyltransferase involved in cell wall biosynthesis
MAKVKPVLSILIPTYNREKFVSRAIESVINQPFSDYEIICSDNASTDNTVSVLLGFAKKNSKVKVLTSKTNIGPVLNWKKCLENSNGDYIHWLWSDDWIEKNFYEDAFDIIKNQQATIINCWNYRSELKKGISSKYLSWQFSFPKVEAIVGAKKIFLNKMELPVSPAAYIIKSQLVKKHFYSDILKVSSKLDPVSKGVGVDSLMVLGAMLESKFLYTITKPSVVFLKHNNISTELSKDRSLSKMYLISHLWFYNHNPFKLSLEELVIFMLSVIKTLRVDLFNLKILRLVCKTSFKLLKNTQNIRVKRKYNSRKVQFNDFE